VITRLERARPAVVWGLLIVLLAVVFVPMSQLRLVDGDEGIYLLDARLVMEGNMLFHDLYWPQMFLTPYIYGVWMKLVVGYSWYGARLLSALAAMALGLLLYAQVTRLTGRRVLGGVAVALFTFSGLEFGWLPLVKTYAFGTLTLFGAYAVLTLSRSNNRWFYSGLLLGLAIDIRLYVVFTAPAFLVELYLDERSDFRARMMQLGRFAAGFVLALLPNQYFLLIDPETFVFNIIGTHAIRSPWGFFGFVDQKIHVALRLFGINYSDGVTSLQFVFLFFASLAGWVGCVRQRTRLALSSTIFLILATVSLLPTPAYTQYFAMTIPFLIVDAVVFASAIVAAGAPAAVVRLGAVVLATYVLLAPLDFYRYTLSGTEIYYVRSAKDAQHLTLPAIRAVGRAIDREVLPERPYVISLWPGYFVETRARILPKMENNFTLPFSRLMTQRDITKFHFMSYPELSAALQRHAVDVVVVGDFLGILENQRVWLKNHVLQSGYVLVDTVGGEEIYKLPAAARTARRRGD
jgi:hypothetical protein